jgi:mono/diheme cytochrome c family protein
MRPGGRRTLGLAALGLAGVALAAWLDGCAPRHPGADDGGGAATPVADASQAGTAAASEPARAMSAIVPDPRSADPVARGAYLALAGNCAGCHTARGGPPYAGGRPIGTPFGTIHASNLTPDAATGIGAWSADDFRRAMHEGRSRDGRALYPAFPYGDYTRVTRADTDALFAYLRSLPPAHAPNRPHALRFPWNLPWLLEAWRWLHFRPADFVPDTTRDAAWNRGAYLVEGLGHCGTCHTGRDALGGPRGVPLGGGTLVAQGWHAPSLRDPAEGGLAHWSQAEATDWLAAGLSDRAVATGPMARVVTDSLQHLAREDLAAMATYLRALPPVPVARPAARATVASDGADADTGARLYRERCADCHGERGEGAPPHWPALAGNRTLTMASPVNTIRAVLHGGFAPATRATPRPYGMPPFGAELDDRQVAALVNHLRAAWGHAASTVEPRAVNALRPLPLD